MRLPYHPELRKEVGAWDFGLGGGNSWEGEWKKICGKQRLSRYADKSLR